VSVAGRFLLPAAIDTVMTFINYVECGGERLGSVVTPRRSSYWDGLLKKMFITKHTQG